MQSVKRTVGNSLFRANDAIGRFRLKRLANCPANPAAVLMYHGLETDPVRLQCNPLDVRPHAFLAEIRFFQRQGYSLVTPDQLSTTLARGTDRASLLVSFDDGNRNAFGTLKDLMQRDQITTMVAVCPQVIESEEVYWWEELLARVAGADNSVQVDLDGDRQVVRKTQGESLVQRCNFPWASSIEPRWSKPCVLMVSDCRSTEKALRKQRDKTEKRASPRNGKGFAVERTARRVESRQRFLGPGPGIAAFAEPVAEGGSGSCGGNLSSR